MYHVFLLIINYQKLLTSLQYYLIGIHLGKNYWDINLNLEIDFYFKEIPTLWVENEKKEECGICYDETNLTTRCKQFKHYVCKECFHRIKNICPYCTRELTEIF